MNTKKANSTSSVVPATPDGPIGSMRKKRELDLSLLGDRIAYARQQRNMTQQQLAEKIDMNPEGVTRIETGARFPNIWNTIALADALDISTDFILRGRDNPFPTP